jgi:Arc/MetJ family transcription regulator
MTNSTRNRKWRPPAMTRKLIEAAANAESDNWPLSGSDLRGMKSTPRNSRRTLTFRRFVQPCHNARTQFRSFIPNRSTDMRTTIEIDDALMAEAQKLSGHATKKQTVEEALRLLIKLRRHNKADNAFDVFGSNLPDEYFSGVFESAKRAPRKR